MRIFLSNTCANQPFQVAEKKAKEGSGANAAAEGGEGSEVKTEGAAESGDVKEEDAVPSWTLRIEGRLLEPSFKSRANTALSAQASINRTGAHKFSNLIKTCVVELMRDRLSTQMEATLSNGTDRCPRWLLRVVCKQVVELVVSVVHKHGGAACGQCRASAGRLRDQAQGQCAYQSQDRALSAYTPERYSLAPELANLLDIREESRAGVISALWSYVKEKKLLDETDRKKVKCDAALRSLFNTETINFHHIPEVINDTSTQPNPS